MEHFDPVEQTDVGEAPGSIGEAANREVVIQWRAIELRRDPVPAYAADDQPLGPEARSRPGACLGRRYPAMSHSSRYATGNCIPEIHSARW